MTGSTLRKRSLLASVGTVVASAALLGACSQTPAEVAAPAPLDPEITTSGVTAAVYSAPEATAGGRSAWAGGRAAWGGGRAAWGGGRSAWAGGDPNVTLVENYDAWKQIRLDVAQQLAPKLGAGVMVAVIDTGVDYTHPALVGHLADRALWKDYVDNDDDPQEVGIGGVDRGFGHGTGVAATILQVAPRASILPLRTLGPDGSGKTDKVAGAISYAVSKGARVINLSLGTEGFDCNIQKTIAQAVPDNVVVVVSAGNNGNLNETFPAATSKQSPNSYYANNAAALAEVKACNLSPNASAQVNVVTVGVGSVSTVNKDRKSDFTTYGSGLEMLAPGETVYTAVPGSLLGAWSGTSFAAPMVAGGLALAMGQTPNPAINPNRMGVYIANSSDKIDYANPQYAGLGYFGFGRLNLETFLKKTIVY